MIVVAGDWNQWPIEHVCQEHTDLTEVDHGPTRKDGKIDKFLVNFGRQIRESDTLPLLDDGFGRASNHWICYFKASIEKQVEPKTTYTNEGAARFKELVESTDFLPIYAMGDPNEQLAFLLERLEGGMDICFSKKTTTRRDRDPPWINGQVRSLVRRRRRIYHRKVRSY